MASLVIYDSNFGNTKLVAETIAAVLGPETPCRPANAVRHAELRGVDLLVLGSPINGWRPTANIGRFIDSLVPNQLAGVRVATFDTRIEAWYHGDAAKTMAKQLTKVGATSAGEPTWFYVTGREGPLKNGELERAKTWAKILKQL